MLNVSAIKLNFDENIHAVVEFIEKRIRIIKQKEKELIKARQN